MRPLLKVYVVYVENDHSDENGRSECKSQIQMVILCILVVLILAKMRASNERHEKGGKRCSEDCEMIEVYSIGKGSKGA